MSHEVIELNDQSFAEALKEDPTVVIDVYASWCGSCRLFAPAFRDVALSQPDLKFYKIDAEKNPEFRNRVTIDNLPFVAVFHKGEYVGGQSTTKKEALVEMIQVIQKNIQ